MIRSPFRVLWSLLLLWVAVPGLASDVFVRPAQLEPDIAFWRRIYTEVSTDGGLIHDPVNLAVVYEVMQFPPDIAPRLRGKKIEDTKKKYSRILDRLAQDAADLSKEEQRVRDLWPKGTRRARFEQAAEEVRFQLGQSDRFLEGLIRSGAYMDHIAATFEKQGLPRELAALPHVESSFNTFAYSKVGAAGMWQFMRATGRRFLRIDNVVDERMDPYRSTEAAARFLEQNYIVLDSWPLALTAYNHGTAGMRRAREQMGTSDITTIVRKYTSRTFGFASRNFYVAFLAALEVDANPDKFFGPVRRNPVDDSHVVVLANFVPASQLTAALGVERDVLHKLNPSLLPSVWNGSRHVPRGFELRIPSVIEPAVALARIAKGERYDAQVADTRHRVRKGESLSAIASHYAVGMTRLAELNGIRRPYRIRAGQELTLPIKVAPAAVLAQVDKGKAIAAPPAKPTPPPPTGVAGTDSGYAVKRGETLSEIASRHGMTEEQLMELNSIRNRNFLYEGQVLVLQAAARVAPPMEAEVAVEVPAAATAPESVAVAEAAEPESEQEADELGPTLLPGAQAAASADPSDYSVHDDDTIRVQAAETIGHYAQWSGLGATQVRRLNRLSKATPVVIGRKLKLEFSKTSRDQFEAQRVAYHKQLQEAFFAEFRISGDATHVIQSGESIWVLAQQRYNIPIWLLRQYNPDVDLGALRPGTKLIIPIVKPANGSESNGRAS